MRESRTYGSARGAPGNRRPYRNHQQSAIQKGAKPKRAPVVRYWYTRNQRPSGPRPFRDAVPVTHLGCSARRSAQRTLPAQNCQFLPQDGGRNHDCFDATP